MAVAQYGTSSTPTDSTTDALPTPRWVLIVLAIVAELAIALASKNAPLLGLGHAVAVVTVGLYAVARRNVLLVTCLIAYLVGAEVLWRQVNAPLYYLFAPYAVILLSAFVVIMVIGKLGRDARLSVLYIALLLPGAITTIRTAGSDSRELIAFALSGPAALAALVAFMSQMSATRSAYRRILWTALVSAVGPLAIAVSDVASAVAQNGSIKFTDQSNFITSGGFGPVQVSAVLGLGVLIALLLTLLESDRICRLIAAVVAFAFAVQSLLTFSRGGMFSAAIALSALAITQARNRRMRNRVMVMVAVALSLGYFVVVPFLTDFTNGAFEKRFSDTQSARTQLAANDTQVFARNIVFGVGPGMIKFQRLGYDICKLRSDKCAQEASSHTEYTRMLGEHGLPGMLAIVVMAVLAFRAVAHAGRNRPYAVAFMAWAIAQMFYANLRVVAVPFAFGIAFLAVRADTGPPPPEESIDRSTDRSDTTGNAAVAVAAKPTWA